MIDLDRLTVSLTKNGYFKIASLLHVYSGADVLDHLWGDRAGIHIVKSQVANMLDADLATNAIPAYWDSIRAHGYKVIDAFSVVAMLFCHHRLIHLLQDASDGQPEFRGYFLRSDMGSEKSFTNFAYALACFGLAPYCRGENALRYDLAPAIYQLRTVGNLVKDLLQRKLERAGWRDPARYRLNPDRDLLTELREQRLHRVLSMEWERFVDFLNNRLTMTAPPGLFGLREVGLFQGV